MGYMTPIQEETRDGVTMRTHRFIEKRPMVRAIPTADPQTPNHYIAEKTDIHQLEIELSGGELLLEPGALQYMHGNISADVVRHEERGFLSRALASSATGESAYATKYSGTGHVWCEPTRRHFILATMDGEQDALLLDDRAFYACSSGITLSTHTHTNISGVLSGNGFRQPKLSGHGVFAVESPVSVEEVVQVELNNEQMVVDGDFMLMYSANLQISIGPLVSGIRNAMRSGEGMVYKIQGRGSVWLTPTSRVT